MTIKIKYDSRPVDDWVRNLVFGNPFRLELKKVSIRLERDPGNIPAHERMAARRRKGGLGWVSSMPLYDTRLRKPDA